MKLVKSLLLGSAAGLCAVAGAQAADLPMRAAAPVEYVRVCSAHGAGFFYIPGSDTCIRISGRARLYAQYMSSRASSPNLLGSNGGAVGRDNLGTATLGQIGVDARTATSYGTLRTFIRVGIGYNTGGYLRSGTAERIGTSTVAFSQDFYGRAQTTILLDRAFIQWAGFTAGRSNSFYDFYAGDYEIGQITASSSTSATNLLAYTATFGGGWSATISLEDSLARRQPIYTDTTVNSTSLLAGTAITQGVPVLYNAAGLPTRVANYDVVQRATYPDVVGVIRYDAAWGSAQASAAMHQIKGGNLLSTQAITGYTANGAPILSTPADTSLAGAAGIRTKIKDEMGWGVQGGVKVNLPMIATGDVLWLQAAYSEGALQYAGQPLRFAGQGSSSSNLSGRFATPITDGYIGADGKMKLTEAWSVSSAFLHYWTPELRSAFFGSYSEVSFGGARGNAGPASFFINPNSVGAAVGRAVLSYNTTLRDHSVSSVGANLIWSPIKDLDIGLEGIYTRVDLKNGRAADLSYTSQTAQTNALGVPVKSIKYDDVWAARLRIQRDF